MLWIYIYICLSERLVWFSLMFSSHFSIRVMLASRNELGCIPSGSILWQWLKRICMIFKDNLYHFFLKYLSKFISEPTLTWCFLFWKVINYQFILIGTGLVILCFSSCVSFGRLAFQRIGPFHQGYQMCGYSVFHYSLIFLTSMEAIVMSFLSFLILVIWVLPFFLA